MTDEQAFTLLKAELDYFASAPAISYRRDRYEQIFAAFRAWLSVSADRRLMLLTHQIIEPALKSNGLWLGLPRAMVNVQLAEGQFPEASLYRSSEIQDQLIQAFYFGLLVDDWNLDQAADVLDTGAKFAALLVRRTRLQEDNEIFENIHKFFDRCYAIRRTDLCERAIPAFDAALKQMRKDESVLWLFDGLSELRDGKRPRIVLKHSRQRLNVQRLADKSILQPSVSLRSNDECSPLPIDFRPLPEFEPEEQPRPSDTTCILFPKPYAPPTVSYTPEQSWEYHEAYFRTRNPKLIEKYLYGRAWALLLSLLLTSQEPAPLLNEAIALAEYFPGKIDGLSEFAKFLRGLTREERNERIALLVENHRRATQSSDSELILVAPDNHWSHSPVTISLSVIYLAAAMQPLDVLRNIFDQPASLTNQMDESWQASWDKTLAFLEKQKSLWSDLMQAEERREYERIVIICETYIARCMAAAGELDHVGEFQFGYYYDRLTVALCKLARWREARAKLEDFFALPDEFLVRCSRSGRQVLRKRLEKCKKKVAS